MTSVSFSSAAWDDVTTLSELTKCCRDYIDKKLVSPCDGKYFENGEYSRDTAARCKCLIDKHDCYVVSAKTPVSTYGEFGDTDDEWVDTEEKSTIKFFVDSKRLPVDEKGESFLLKQLKETDIYFTSYNFETKECVSNFPKDDLFIPTARIRRGKLFPKAEWKPHEIIFHEKPDSILHPFNDTMKDLLKHSIYITATAKKYNTLCVEDEIMWAWIRAEEAQG